jgi:NADPH:quinone reductase-like Zn-dependent oxidoreductase
LKAVRIHQHGGVDQLRYEESPDPELNAPNDVIVRLKAAAINRLDLQIRSGLSGVDMSLPHILGAEGAGVVTLVGSDVKNIKPGDAVCLYPAIGCGGCEYCVTDREIMCPHLNLLGEQSDGTYAEHVRVPERNCFPIPRGLSFEAAAAFPLAFVTVWHMLVTNAEIKPGELVLILGIGGGMASAALQVARCFGAKIIVTSSSDRKISMARELGAAHGINHLKTDFAKEVRNLTDKHGADIVVDCIGGESWVRSLAALAKGGRLVTCGAVAGAQPQTHLQRIFWNHLKVFGSRLGSRNEFHQVLKFLEVSGAEPVLDRVYPLKDAGIAQQRLEHGEQFGKIVLRMDG